MLTTIALAIFLLIIGFVIFREYRNEQRYKSERRSRNEQNKTTLPKKRPPSAPTPALPVADYKPFDHSRLLEMGLSDKEAHEFVQALISQLNTQIPLIAEAIEEKDFKRMERLTHSLKGSATNIGSGGIADLLIKFNTYLKSGTELLIAQAYFKHLKHYLQELSNQYS